METVFRSEATQEQGRIEDFLGLASLLTFSLEVEGWVRRDIQQQATDNINGRYCKSAEGSPERGLRGT